MLLKVRSLALGVLSMAALGIGASAALANPGPFWYHREPGKQASQVKISEAAPEAFEGKSAGAELSTKVGGSPITLLCTLVTKGSVWNQKTQGQGKLAATFEACKVTTISGCTATVTPEGEYTLLMVYKYDENPKELENKQQKLQGQRPDSDVIPKGTQLALNSEHKELEVTKGSFATIKFSTEKCGVISGLSGKVEGSTAFSFEPEPDQFAKEFKLTFPGNAPKQHAWWPPEQKYVALMQKLQFSGSEAKFNDEMSIVFANEEVAVEET